MKIIIRAITIKGSLALMKTKKDWLKQKVDTNFNTIRIAQVKSSWVYFITTPEQIKEHILEYTYPPKANDLKKFTKGLKKSMLQINESVFDIDYTLIIEND